MLLIPNSRGQGHANVSISDAMAEELVGNAFKRSKETFYNLQKGLLNVSKESYEWARSRPHSIFMGGDHLTSYATVLSSYKRYKNNFRLVWIDAHTDIHSFNSSLSWNLHGMVVRLLLNKCLKPEQVLFIGIRSCEDEELKYIKDSAIQCITMKDWKNNKLNSIKVLKNFISGFQVHVSFDVDALDPTIMSSTGTPVNNGFCLNDFSTIINTIRSEGLHIATDIMEFNPNLGYFESSFKTLKKVVNILKKKVKKTSKQTKQSMYKKNQTRKNNKLN
jgi:arginase